MKRIVIPLARTLSAGVLARLAERRIISREADPRRRALYRRRAGRPSRARPRPEARLTLWGQQVVVENKPGANEIIAAQDIAKSPADGYNYLLASDAVFSLNSYLYSKLPYDPVKDLARCRGW